jgi:hypothetical protein
VKRAWRYTTLRGACRGSAPEMAACWWDGDWRRYVADRDARTHASAVSVHGCHFWRCVRTRPSAGRPCARHTILRIWVGVVIENSSLIFLFQTNGYNQNFLKFLKVNP